MDADKICIATSTHHNNVHNHLKWTRFFIQIQAVLSELVTGELHAKQMSIEQVRS